MAITNSVALVDAHSQQGGGHWVTELHTDSTGRVHTIGPYYAPEGFDVNARLVSHTTELAASLAAAEFAQLVE